MPEHASRLKMLIGVLLLTVATSGCSVAGINYALSPDGSAGWRISQQKEKEKAGVEFACKAYNYRAESLGLGNSRLFGPPLIPFIPSLFNNESPVRAVRPLNLVMEGDHAETPCPIITLNGKEYKAFQHYPDDKNTKTCDYRIPTSKAGFSVAITDSRECQVPPLSFELTSEWFYYPVAPPELLFR